MSYKVWKDEPFDWAPQKKLGSTGWIAFKDSPSAPPPPDYAGAAAATAQGNQDALNLQTELNRVNQSGPWGSVTYTQPGAKFDEDGYNAAYNRYREQEDFINSQPDGGAALRQYMSATGISNKAPSRSDYTSGNLQWSQTTTLDPRLQQALDSQLAIQNGRSDIALSQLDRLRQAYSTEFQAPDRATYMQGMPGVNYGSNDRAGQFSSTANINTDLNGALTGVNSVNQNVAQYDPSAMGADLYAKKAFDAQMALLQPGRTQQDTALRNGLALQGFTPDSEASRNATQGYELAKNAADNSLAASSYLTGQQAAQGAYNTYLGGVRAGNDAQGQAYTQAVNNFTTNNQAQAQKFLQDQSTYGTNLQGLTTNSQLTAAQNAAQQQDYTQRLSNYATDWQQALALRNQPLNEVNALLNGQQVQNPSFPNVNGSAGATTGADYLSALQNQTQYNQGLYNQQAAAASQANSSAVGAGASLASAALIAFSDERLKKNVEKVGETPQGRNIYSWDWNDKAGGYLGPRVGVLAQENPDAAIKTKSGYLAVDYSKIH